MRSPLAMPFFVVLAAFSVGMVAVLSGVGGDDPSRVSLAGTILLDGKPLESGTIRFFLTSPSEQIHVDVSLVQNGEYAIAGSEALIPGTYKVVIKSYAQETVPRAIKSNADDIPPEQRFRVSSRYNENSILEVKIQHGGLSRFDFNLKN